MCYIRPPVTLLTSQHILHGHLDHTIAVTIATILIESMDKSGSSHSIADPCTTFHDKASDRQGPGIVVEHQSIDDFEVCYYESPTP